MSEEVKSGKMLPDIKTEFKDILAKCLEEIVSKDDRPGCVELIGFIRRFLKNVPVNDYRTTGYPVSIKFFLDACGLEDGTDYEVKGSSLDSESFMMSFKPTAKMTTVLGLIAGMRVEDGPSVADRMYCEMIKGGNRNFLATMDLMVSNNKPNVTDYITDRNEHVYSELAEYLKKMSEDDKANCKFINELEFASKQLVGGKLSPNAPAFLPLAVAEAFVRIKSNSSCASALMYRIGNNPGEWVSARVMSSNEETYRPAAAVAAMPLQLARKFSTRFDKFMPKNMAEFRKAEVYNGAGDPDVGDCAFVVVGAPVNVPGVDIADTKSKFMHIAQPSSLIRNVELIYHECYPHLRVSWVKRSGVRYRFGSKYYTETEDYSELDGYLSNAGIKREDIAKTIGEDYDEDDPGITFTGAFVISPYSGNATSADFPSPVRISPNIIVRDGDEESSGKGDKVNVAKAWFETIHGKAAPDFKVEEFPKKMGKYLADCLVSTETVGVPNAMAVGLRSAISRAMGAANRCGYSTTAIDLTKTMDGDKVGVLHTKDKYITQIATTVSGHGATRIGAFLKSNAEGKRLSAPSINSNDYLTEYSPGSMDAHTEFIDVLEDSDLQIREPKSVSGFNIYAETNFSYSTLMWLQNRVSGFSTDARRCIGNEVCKILLSRLTNQDRDNKLLEKVKKVAGANSSMLSLMKNARGMSTLESLFSCTIVPDHYGRAIICMTINPTLAFAIMLSFCESGNIDAMIKMAMSKDPYTVFVSKDNWKSEVCDYLLGKYEKTATVPPIKECVTTWLENNTGFAEDIQSNVTLDTMFNKGAVDEMFRTAGSCGYHVDPN